MSLPRATAPACAPRASAPRTASARPFRAPPPRPPCCRAAAASATPPPPPPQLLPATSSAVDARTSLLAAIAPLDRGRLARAADAARVESAARRLEAEFPAARSPPSALRGRWRLLYISSPETFRQSPFFDAFFAAVGDKAAAEAIFRFTGELPMAAVGSAWQTIELGGGGADGAAAAGGASPSGWLVSEVELAVGALPFFEGFKGVVESTAAIQSVSLSSPFSPSSSSSAAAGVGAGAGAGGSSSYLLQMEVTQTRVTNSPFTPLGGDSIVAPVEAAFERVRGPGAARCAYEVTALAAGGGGGGEAAGGAGDLRVTRTLGGGQGPGPGLLMVHLREDDVGAVVAW